MKCVNCGAEIDDGAAFCKECGTKVQQHKMKAFCRECGAKLVGNEKFCSNCGAKIGVDTTDESEPADKDKEYTAVESEDKKSEEAAESDNARQTKKVKSEENISKASAKGSHENTDQFVDKVKQNLFDKWNKLSTFGKAAVIVTVIILLLLLVALFSGKAVALIIAIMQICIVVAAICMYKGVIELEERETWVKWLLLGIALVLCILNIASYSWRNNKVVSDSASSNTETVLNVNAPFDANECIGQSCIDVQSAFTTAGFTNIEVEKIEDLKLDDASRLNAVESVSIGDDAEFIKSKEFKADEKVLIRYHAYAKCNVKIHVNFIPNLLFSKYNVKFLLNGNEEGRLTHGTDKDFELSIDPGDYTITFESVEKSSVNGEVALTVDSDLEAAYEIICNADNVSVKSLYVDRMTELAEGEIKLNTSALNYRDKNYKDVTAALTELGFTNIKSEILYDIVFGVTETGAVESVKIAGNTDFRRGDVFKSDDEVIVTYHMPEADDPNKPVETKPTQTESTTAEVQETKKQESNLTIDNCPELAAMLSNKADMDSSYAAFASKYKGRTIEFDGRIDYCTKNGTYNTRYDFLVSAGDYDPNHQVGPSFKFEDVNIYELHTDVDTVGVGMNMHIVAKVDSYNTNSGLFYLEPVAVTSR